MNSSKNAADCQTNVIFSVYVIWCNKTNMHYVGVTSQQPVYKRIREHKRGKQFVDHEIRDIGWDGNFDWWIVETNVPSNLISKREQHWIAFFDSVFPNGYNKTHGGIGKVTMSEDTRVRMKKSHLGKPNGRKGTRHTEETKTKMRSRRHTDEEIAKMSAANKGEKNPFFGKHHTEEAKEKNRQAHLGKTPWNKGKKAVKRAAQMTP